MSQQIKVVLNYFIEPNDVGHVNYRLRKSLTIDLVRKAVQSLLICYTISESHVYITLLHTQTRTKGFLIILVSKRLSFWKNLSLKIFCQTAVGPTYKMMLRLYMLISPFKLFGRDSEISIFLIPNLYMLISPLMPEILFAFFICIAKIHCMTMTSGAELLIEL